MTIASKASHCLAALVLLCLPVQAQSSKHTLTSKPPPPSAVVVHIIDLYGKPVSNVSLHPDYFIRRSAGAIPAGSVPIPIAPLSHAYHAWTQKTDQSGNATFSGLPEAYILFVGVQDDRFAQLSADKHAHLQLTSDSQPITVIVSPGGTIEGDVKFGATGQPAVGIRVGAVDTQIQPGQGIGFATTDANGHYKISQLIPDTYNVELDLPSFLSYKWTAVAHEKVAVPAAETISGQDFDLISGSTLTGTITDPVTSKPVPGVGVGIFGPAHPASSPWPAATKSGLDGTFSIRVPQGKQKVVILQSGSGTQGASQDVDAVDGQTESINLQSTAPVIMKTVTGKVEDPAGKPLAGATVTDLSTGRQTTANADGTFQFTVESVSDPLKFAAVKGNLGTKEPIAVRNSDPVVLRLTAGVLGKITGTVKDDHNTPIIYAYVDLHRDGLTVAIAKTDILGGYSFEGLLPNFTYSVTVDERGYITTNTSSATLKPAQSLVMTPLVIKRMQSSVASAELR